MLTDKRSSILTCAANFFFLVRIELRNNFITSSVSEKID